MLVLPAKTWKNRKVRVNKTWRDKKTKWGRGALWLVKVGSGLPTSSLSKNISALFKFENKEFDHCTLGPHYGVYGTDYTVRYNRPVKLSEKRSERNTSKSIEILGWILRERTQKLLKNFTITEQSSLNCRNENNTHIERNHECAVKITTIGSCSSFCENFEILNKGPLTKFWSRNYFVLLAENFFLLHVIIFKI